MNALRALTIVLALAILMGCAGVERKAELGECITDVLERDDELRGFTSELDNIAEDLMEFLSTSGDELSDERYGHLDDCQQKISMQASSFGASAIRVTLEMMSEDERELNRIYDSFLSRRIWGCLQ